MVMICFSHSGSQDSMDLEALTLLVLIRISKQSLPPLLHAWRPFSIEYLYDLHELFCASSDDLCLQMAKDIMLQTHDFSSLRLSLVCLRDAWKRYSKRHWPLPEDVLLTLKTLEKREKLCRRDVQASRSAAIRALQAVSLEPLLAWTEDAVSACRERDAMQEEDFDCGDLETPAMRIKSLWGSGVLRPGPGVEIDMPLPDLEQAEFDLVLMYWHIWQYVSRFVTFFCFLLVFLTLKKPFLADMGVK